MIILCLYTVSKTKNDYVKTSFRFRAFKWFSLFFSCLCYHEMRENILRAATFIRTRRPRVPFHSASKLLENLRKRRKERVKRFPSPYLTFAPSALPCLFTDSRKGKRRRMERIQGTYERESRKEGTRGTPFTAQWAPLKPKVMKVSGCLSRSPSLAARFATWPPLRHAQDICIPGVRSERSGSRFLLFPARYRWRSVLEFFFYSHEINPHFVE